MAAFAAVVLAFTASSLLSGYRSHTVEGRALQISNELAPGIHELAEARAQLREVVDGLRAGRHAAAAAAWATAFDLASAYFARRADSAQARQLAPLVRGLDDQVLRALSSSDPTDAATEQAIRGLTGASALALKCLQTDADLAQALAARVRRVYDSARRVGFALDAASIALAVVAVVTLRRSLRHHAALRDAHTRLLEDRAGELESFGQRLAHDLAGSLTPAMLALELAARQTSDERLGRTLERGLTSLRRGEESMRALLAFARAGARPSPGGRADVGTNLADVADELTADAERLRVQVHVRARAGDVAACDAGILHSIVANLARNAVRYTGGQGGGHVTLRASAQGPVVRIEVQDDGPGVAPGEEAAIFEPYVRGSRVKPDGLGLGLATVKRLATAHGGAVGVERVSTGGSLFWVELPRAPVSP